MGENIFKSYKNKWLVFRIYKEDLKPGNEKIVNPITMAKVFEDIFFCRRYTNG